MKKQDLAAIAVGVLVAVGILVGVAVAVVAGGSEETPVQVTSIAEAQAFCDTFSFIENGPEIHFGACINSTVLVACLNVPQDALSLTGRFCGEGEVCGCEVGSAVADIVDENEDLCIPEGEELECEFLFDD